MKKTVRRVALLAGLVAVCGLIGIPSDGTSESTTLIKVDGSSTVFPITEAVAEEFQKETRGAVRVTVGISGTGGGFKKPAERRRTFRMRRGRSPRVKWKRAGRRAFNIMNCP